MSQLSVHLKPRYAQAVWTCVAAAIVGFFMPWGRVQMHESQLFKKFSFGMHRSLGDMAAHGKRSSWHAPKAEGLVPGIPTQLSGFQIPVVANGQQAKVAIDLIQLFMHDRNTQTIGLKSWAVYAVPGFALLFGWLLTSQGGRRPVAILLGLLCASIAGAGFWQILTMPQSGMMTVTICWGLWLCLGAYLGLALIALASTAPVSVQERLEQLLRIPPVTSS